MTPEDVRELANIMELAGYSRAMVNQIHAHADEFERLQGSILRRSGASSWEELQGAWSPTEETAIDAIKRLVERVWELETVLREMLDHLYTKQDCDRVREMAQDALAGKK